MQKILLLIAAAILVIHLFGWSQESNRDLEAIIEYCNKIDSDTITIKRIQVPSSKMSDSGILGPTHIFYHKRNDTVFKVETFIGHMHPQNIEYYYKKEGLIYCRYTDYGRLTNYPTGSNRLNVERTEHYYFSQGKLIHVLFVPARKRKRIKARAEYLIEMAEYYLHFVK